MNPQDTKQSAKPAGTHEAKAGLHLHVGPQAAGENLRPVENSNTNSAAKNMLFEDAQNHLKPVLIQKQLRPTEAATGKQKASTADPVLPDSPYQPTSRCHVAEVASSIVSQASSSSSSSSRSPGSPPVLPDSPFQPSSHAHVARVASELASRRCSSDTHTPNHTPVLHDSGDFQPTSRSHVSQLVNQVASRLQQQNSSSSNSSASASPLGPHTPEDCPYQPSSNAHTSEMVKTYKKMLAQDGSPSAATKLAGVSTPHNTPLAGDVQSRVLATAALWDSNSCSSSSCSDSPAAVDYSAPSDGGMPEIIHLAYGKGALFKGASDSSQVSKLVHKFAAASTDSDNDSQSPEPHFTTAGSHQLQAEGGKAGEVGAGINARTCFMPDAATPPGSIDGVQSRSLAPRMKPQVVANRQSSRTIIAARAKLEQTASAELKSSAAVKLQDTATAKGVTNSDANSCDGINPLYRPSASGVELTGTVRRLSMNSSMEQQQGGDDKQPQSPAM